MKLNLIYNAKSKINTKWWKIKMKAHNLTQIILQNDPINRRMQGFSFRIFEDESGVQDGNSPSSLDQIWISSIQMKRKWVTNKKKQTAREMVEYTRWIWRNSTSAFFRREELHLKRRKWAWPLDLMDSSRSTVRWRAFWLKRRLGLMTVRSHLKGRDAISSRVWGETSFDRIHWILIQRSRFNPRSIGSFKSPPL